MKWLENSPYHVYMCNDGNVDPFCVLDFPWMTKHACWVTDPIWLVQRVPILIFPSPAALEPRPPHHPPGTRGSALVVRGCRLPFGLHTHKYEAVRFAQGTQDLSKILVTSCVNRTESLARNRIFGKTWQDISGVALREHSCKKKSCGKRTTNVLSLFSFFQEEHLTYNRMVEEVKEKQAKCMKGIAHHKYRYKQLVETLNRLVSEVLLAWSNSWPLVLVWPRCYELAQITKSDVSVPIALSTLLCPKVNQATCHRAIERQNIVSPWAHLIGVFFFFFTNYSHTCPCLSSVLIFRLAPGLLQIAVPVSLSCFLWRCGGRPRTHTHTHARTHAHEKMQDLQHFVVQIFLRPSMTSFTVHRILKVAAFCFLQVVYTPVDRWVFKFFVPLFLFSTQLCCTDGFFESCFGDLSVAQA